MKMDKEQFDEVIKRLNKIESTLKKIAVTGGITGSADTTKPWNLLPIDLLEIGIDKAVSGDIAKNVEIIQKTLANFGVEASMGNINIGPTVTQYTLRLTDDVKLNKITAMVNDLSSALDCNPIRIDAPIPGKSIVGIEIPNKVAANVGLREILESENFKNSESNLTLALGRDVSGEIVTTDLKVAPHILIAGATGSGKSVCINAMILSLLYQNSPNDLRLILIDFKRVEFNHYNDIPHLLCPVIFDVDKAVSALRWTVAETDRRFHVLQDSRQKNIEDYNQSHPSAKMPYIVIFIDELSDLMAQSGEESEAGIERLARISRAVGIHLVMATSRPSTDIITDKIKAEIPNRIAFAVASEIDSNTIIDANWADKLFGRGDMLYLSNNNGVLNRIQGAFVTDKEINNVTNFLKSQRLYTASEISNDLGSDELYDEAKEIVINSGKASASLLQRRLKTGYARAARLLDMLEEEGVIGPAEGAKPRDVLVDLPLNSEDEIKK